MSDRQHRARQVAHELLGGTRNADPLELQLEALAMLLIGLLWLAVMALAHNFIGDVADTGAGVGVTIIILFAGVRFLYQASGWSE